MYNVSDLIFFHHILATCLWCIQVFNSCAPNVAKFLKPKLLLKRIQLHTIPKEKIKQNANIVTQCKFILGKFQIHSAELKKKDILYHFTYYYG